ncbi:MAG: DUF445 family protein [Fusobacteria bacterium]|nr:DUF445 family protein [Fusobacteriota bacterium]
MKIKRSRKGNISLLTVLLLFIFFELWRFNIGIFGLDLRRLLISVCEAGLVGAIADWYAVTCLFRYPLNIKVPHGNILAKKKDEIANGLSIVVQKFLPSSVVEEKIREINFHRYIQEFINDVKFQKDIKEKLITFISQNLDEFKKLSALEKGVGELVIFLRKRDFAKDVAKIIEGALSNGFIDIMIPKFGMVVKNYIIQNRKRFENDIENKVKSHLWGPLKFFANKKGQDVVNEILEELDKVENSSSDIICEIKNQLLSYQNNLLKDTFDAVSFNVVIEKVLSQKNIRDHIISGIDQLILSLLEFLSTESRGASQTEKIIDKMIQHISTNLLNEECSAIINHEISELLIDTAQKYSLIDTLTQLIKREIISMSEKEFIRYIEDEVYDDLQYIRLNGAIVGGLVGGFLYIVTTLL